MAIALVAWTGMRDRSDKIWVKLTSIDVKGAFGGINLMSGLC